MTLPGKCLLLLIEWYLCTQEPNKDSEGVHSTTRLIVMNLILVQVTWTGC